MILFIDPGVHDIGWCFLRTEPASEIVDCGFMAFTTYCGLAAWLDAHEFDKLVIEMPRADLRSKHSLKIINDLLDVAATVGACASAYKDPRIVYPHEWKGSMPKDKHQANRIMPALLKRPEGARIAKTLAAMTKAKRIDVLDAVGLALWWIENG